MLLISLGEDESDAFLVCCGGIHAFAASLVFTMLDFITVISTLWFYLNHVIVRALIISISTFPTGPYGLYHENQTPLRIYLWRLRVIFVFSFCWMCICMFLQEENIGFFVGLIWLAATILYIIGSNFCSTTLDFLDDYRGFDGADPEIYEKITGIPLESEF